MKQVFAIAPCRFPAAFTRIPTTLNYVDLVLITGVDYFAILCNLLPVAVYHLSHLLSVWHQGRRYKVSSGLNTLLLLGLAMCRYTMVVSIDWWPNSSLMLRMFTPCSSR